MVQWLDGRHLARICDDLAFRERVDRQRQQQIETAKAKASADNLVTGIILKEAGIRNSLVAEFRIKRAPKKEEASIRRKRAPAEGNFYDIKGRSNIEIRNDLHIDEGLEEPSLKQRTTDLVLSSGIGT